MPCDLLRRELKACCLAPHVRLCDPGSSSRVSMLTTLKGRRHLHFFFPGVVDKCQEVGEALGGDIQLLSRDGRRYHSASGMPGAFRTALSPGFAVGGSLQPGPDARFCLWRLVVSERQAQQGAIQSHAKNRTCVRESALMETGGALGFLQRCGRSGGRRGCAELRRSDALRAWP